MTGFLAHEWLRAHQAPFDLRHEAGLERPLLVAVWSAGPEGRPVCRWAVSPWNDEDDPH
jgi:hypothetical protein